MVLYIFQFPTIHCLQVGICFNLTRYNFNPSDIYVNVNGDVKKKEKYYAISFDEYSKKVKRRQNSNAF